VTYVEISAELNALEITVTQTLRRVRKELWHREYDHFMDRQIEELELSVRTYNCLKNAEIFTIREMLKYSPKEMKKLKNFGKKAVDEVRELLQRIGPDIDLRADSEPKEMKKGDK
jgi:DNA-directed RNA polymerase alpha subunit